MALLIGVSLAIAVGLLATGLGLDRDRAFYPVVMIVIASYHALFAVMGASTHALVLESLAGAEFIAVAAIGFRRSLWIVAIALTVHGVFDPRMAHILLMRGCRFGGHISASPST